MNTRRIAALFRELAELFEQEQPSKKPKARRVQKPAVEPKKEDSEEARRALRKAGFAA